MTTRSSLSLTQTGLSLSLDFLLVDHSREPVDSESIWKSKSQITVYKPRVCVQCTELQLHRETHEIRCRSWAHGNTDGSESNVLFSASLVLNSSPQGQRYSVDPNDLSACYTLQCTRWAGNVSMAARTRGSITQEADHTDWDYSCKWVVYN